ncbi:hypothetical protein [Candidatus Magnetominusculus dajiuhuensis]|uniref:hypothetical protein n=1 Tax=Candidatus Magnetominusculus dajiuhuensis TaxID=3137712 RepID=UPI0019E99AD6|nr:hypothetical protein [Nitrospirota bacterium]
MRVWRDNFAIETHQGVVGFAQTIFGRVFLLLLFSIAYSAATEAWKPSGVVFAAAAFAFLPRYRTVIIFVATLGVLAKDPFWYGMEAIDYVMKQERLTSLSGKYSAYVALVSFFVCSLATLELVRRNKTLYVARRPVITLIAAVAVMSVTAAYPILHGTPLVLLWAFITVFSAYIWFLAYSLVDQRSRDRSPHLFQLGTFHPFWGSSSVPYGKGATFLRKTLAKTSGDLAVTQLKGLKLVLWTVVLLWLRKLLVWVFEVKLKIPDVAALQAFHVTGQGYSILVGWTAVVWATASDTLVLAIAGHKAVAVARLAGFRLPRNTWRPLQSRTLAEFWNRYYYYFKELLVEFFFIPTFLRTFRNHPRLRMFFATFMAAGIGNAAFHFIRDIKFVATQGLWDSIVSYQSYVFYTFVLATGIGISQVRMNSGAKPSNAFHARLWSFLCVWTFVVCLHVFGDETRVYTLWQRLSFMASLIGVK